MRVNLFYRALVLLVGVVHFKFLIWSIFWVDVHCVGFLFLVDRPKTRAQAAFVVGFAASIYGCLHKSESSYASEVETAGNEI